MASGFLLPGEADLDPKAELLIWGRTVEGESRRIKPRINLNVIASTFCENDGFLMAFAVLGSLSRCRILRGKSTKD
jgi:hypothetical protein